MSVRMRVQTAPSAGLGSNADFGPWLTVASSNVLQARYREKDSTMDVQFRNGNVYRYETVPTYIFEQLLSSSSKGGFMHRHVKGKYKYTRIS